MSYTKNFVFAKPVDYEQARLQKERYRQRFNEDQELAERSLSRYTVNPKHLHQNDPGPSAPLCVACQNAFHRYGPDKAILTWLSRHCRRSFNLCYRQFDWAEIKNSAEHGCLICMSIVSHLDQHPPKLERVTAEPCVVAFEVPYSLKPLRDLEDYFPPSHMVYPEYYTKFTSKLFFRYLNVHGPFIVEVSLLPDRKLDAALLVKSFEMRLSRDIAPLSLDAELSSRLLSDESLQTAKTWLHDCLSNHDECNKSERDSQVFSPLPNRLLRIGTSSGIRDFDSLRVETFVAPTMGSYATLSYCWGDTENFRLLNENAKDLEQHIPYSSLPKTIQDALIVTRALGLCYLWVDALCIIQDSPEDWQEQSVRMGDIYRFSSCTIAATAGTNPHEGLDLERRSQCRKASSVKVSLKGISEGTYHIYDAKMWQSQITSMPLNSRGWVLQEQLLSPRTLHFTKSEIFWECRSLKASETYPGSLPGKLVGYGHFSRVDSAAINSQKLPVLHPNWQTQPGDLWKVYEQWRDMICTFSKCELKYQTDKLIAISGLAEYVQRLHHDQYYAGLWKSHLLHDLLWSVPDRENCYRATTYQAPSWSWASMNSEIEYKWMRKVGGKAISCITRIHVQKEGHNTGQVTNGLLTINGPIAELHFNSPAEGERTKEDFDEGYRGRSIRINGRRHLGGGSFQLCGKPCYQPIFKFDEQTYNPGRLFLLMLFYRDTNGFTRTINTPYHVYGMLLALPSKDAIKRGSQLYLAPSRLYVRIGLMEVKLSADDFRFFEHGSPLRTIVEVRAPKQQVIPHDERYDLRETVRII